MTTASDIAGQIVSSETDATVAAGAAESALVAADAAVILAQTQAAIVTADAAATIQETVSDIDAAKEKISWLENRLSQTEATMETQNMAMLASISALEATVATLVLKSAESPSPIPSSELTTGAIVEVEPSEVVADPPEAAPNAVQPSKPRLKRL